MKNTIIISPNLTLTWDKWERQHTAVVTQQGKRYEGVAETHDLAIGLARAKAAAAVTYDLPGDKPKRRLFGR